MGPFSGWRRHFEQNAGRPLPPVDDAREIPAAVRSALASSLARFQLGEAGEGRIAKEIDDCGLPGVDADYRRALKLFVREEGRHARILGRLVRSLGGQSLKGSWSERLFRRGRRGLDTRLKLLVLLSAEVIALGFYGALAASLPPGNVRSALEEICEDELEHLRFHCDWFRLQTPGSVERAVFRLTWRCVAGSACAVVLLDHAGTLRVLECSVSGTARELLGWIQKVEDDVLAPRVAPLEPMPQSTGSSAWRRGSC